MRAHAAALALAAGLAGATGATERFVPEHVPAPPPALNAAQTHAAQALDARWSDVATLGALAPTVLGEAVMDTLYGRGSRIIALARATPGARVPIPVDASTEVLTIVTVGTLAPHPQIAREGETPLETTTECAAVSAATVCRTETAKAPGRGTYWLAPRAGETLGVVAETLGVVAMAGGEAERLEVHENGKGEIWASLARGSVRMTGLDAEALGLDAGWRVLERVALVDAHDGAYRGAPSRALCPEHCTVLVRVWSARGRARTTMRGTTAYEPSFDDHRNSANAVDDAIERTATTTVTRGEEDR